MEFIIAILKPSVGVYNVSTLSMNDCAQVTTMLYLLYRAKGRIYTSNEGHNYFGSMPSKYKTASFGPG